MEISDLRNVLGGRDILVFNGHFEPLHRDHGHVSIFNGRYKLTHRPCFQLQQNTQALGLLFIIHYPFVIGGSHPV